MNRGISIRLAIAGLLSFGCGGGGGSPHPAGAGGNSSAAGRGGGAATAGTGGGTAGVGTAGAGTAGAGGSSTGTGGGTAGAGAGGRGGSGTAGAGTAGAGTGGSLGTAGRGGTTGTAGAGGRGGTGTAGSGGSSSGPTVVDIFDDSAGMTVAVDSTGTIHVAAATIVQQGNGYTVAYARCPGQCNLPQSWTGVALGLESDVSHVPTIALTANGRPRIAYASELGATPGFHYLECDTGCDQLAGWHDVRLTMGDPGVNPLPRPSMPFAVSPGGAAAFFYDDGFGMYTWFCAGSCAQGASWKLVTLGGVYIYPESAAFSTDQSLQVVARHASMNNESLLWMDCTGDCSNGANWNGLDNLVTVPGQLEAAIARTSTGGTRIVFYGDNPATSAVESVFGTYVCDSACRTAANWQAPLSLPIAAGAANVGFSLALDSGGRPVVGMLDDTTSGIARCTSGDCGGASGLWQVGPGPDVTLLNAAYPPTVPASCLTTSWGMYVGPSIALAPNGNPVLAFTASASAFGGACGNGSAATITSSFLSLP
jgi:hypothetical protein